MSFVSFQIISDARDQRQRDWEDDEENEMDRGRQKKIKTPKDPYVNSHTSTTPGYNPFQEHDNQKRWKRYHNVGGGGAGGFRQNFHRNKFKFQRFPPKFAKRNMISSGGGGGIHNINRRNDS